MKSLILTFLTLCSIFNLNHLQSEPRRCSSNDTIVGINEDQNNLMDYLKGTWNVSGSWMIQEGQGKIKKNIRARITGMETFSPILNGHFLQKQLTGRMKYNSRDLDKSVQEAFTSMSLLTFNSVLNQFYNWYFDCSGHFAEYQGTFNQEENRYIFNSKLIDENAQQIETEYTLSIVDDNHYRWEIQKRVDASNEWQSVASGLSTRKH